VSKRKRNNKQFNNIDTDEKVITENTDKIEEVREDLNSEQVSDDFLGSSTRRDGLEIKQSEGQEEMEIEEETHSEILDNETEESSENGNVYETNVVVELKQEDSEMSSEDPMINVYNEGCWVDTTEEDKTKSFEEIPDDGSGRPSDISNSDIYEKPFDKMTTNVDKGSESKAVIQINPSSSVIAEELKDLMRPDTDEELKSKYKNEDFDIIDLDSKIKESKTKKKIIISVIILSIVGILIYASYKTGVTPKTLWESINKIENTEKDPSTLEELKVISLATVNGIKISEADLQEYNKIHRYNYLNSMIDSVLLKQYGESLGVKLEDKEVEETLKNLIESYSSNKEFERTIYEGGTTIEGFKDNMVTNLLRDKIVEKISNDLVVTEEEAQTYFNNSKDEISSINIKYAILNKTDEADTFRKKLAETKDINILLKLFEDNSGSVSEQTGITKYDSLFGADVATSNIGDIIIKSSDTTDNLILGMVTDKNDTYEKLKDSIINTIKNYKKYQVFENGFNTFRENSEIKYVEVAE